MYVYAYSLDPRCSVLLTGQKSTVSLCKDEDSVFFAVSRGAKVAMYKFGNQGHILLQLVWSQTTPSSSFF